MSKTNKIADEILDNYVRILEEETFALLSECEKVKRKYEELLVQYEELKRKTI